MPPGSPDGRGGQRGSVMKRNTLFGAAAMLMAGAAIGAGAVITQNAMADDGNLPADTLTMVNIGSDGSAISCTFTGDDIVGLVPVGIPTDDVAKEAAIAASGEVSGAIAITGTAEVAGELPVIDTAGAPAIPLPEGSAEGVVTVQVGAEGGPVNINGSVGDVRDGTPDECQAMHDQAVADLQKLQSQVQAQSEAQGSLQGGVQVSGGSVVVDSSGEVTVSVKP